MRVAVTHSHSTGALETFHDEGALVPWSSVQAVTRRRQRASGDRYDILNPDGEAEQQPLAPFTRVEFVQLL